MTDVTEPKVVQVLRAYRASLDAMELGVIEALGRRWLMVEDRLMNDITALEAKIREEVKAGRKVSQQLIWRMETYKRMKARLEEELNRFNDDAAREIGERQIEFAMHGVRSGADAIRASYQTAVGAWFPVINRGAVEAMSGLLSNGAPLLSLLKQDYPLALDGLVNALINGMARGMNSSEIAKEMATGMGMGLNRALLIARTECANAYRFAQIEQYRQSRVVTGFRRLVKKATACAACLMLDGEKFSLAEQLYDHPAGKCQAVPDVKGVKPVMWETGREYFERLSPDEQKARMGAERYALWKDGAFELGDLAQVQENATWGKSPRVATLKELGG